MAWTHLGAARAGPEPGEKEACGGQSADGSQGAWAGGRPRGRERVQRRDASVPSHGASGAGGGRPHGAVLML